MLNRMGETIHRTIREPIQRTACSVVSNVSQYAGYEGGRPRNPPTIDRRGRQAQACLFYVWASGVRHRTPEQCVCCAACAGQGAWCRSASAVSRSVAVCYCSFGGVGVVCCGVQGCACETFPCLSRHINQRTDRRSQRRGLCVCVKAKVVRGVWQSV